MTVNLFKEIPKNLQLLYYSIQISHTKKETEAIVERRTNHGHFLYFYKLDNYMKLLALFIKIFVFLLKKRQPNQTQGVVHNQNIMP